MRILNLQEPLKSASAEVGLFYTAEKGRLSEQVKKLLLVSAHLSWPCSGGNWAAGAIATVNGGGYK